MMFHKIFQTFIVLAVGSVASVVVASNNAIKPMQPIDVPFSEGKNVQPGGFAVPLPVVRKEGKKKLKRAPTPTPPLTEYLHSQPINTTGKVNVSMKCLELSEFITSLYIDKEGPIESDRPLLNEADQKKLAGILKGSAVKKLIFRGCKLFELSKILEDTVKDKNIVLSWE